MITKVSENYEIDISKVIEAHSLNISMETAEDRIINAYEDSIFNFDLTKFEGDILTITVEVPPSDTHNPLSKEDILCNVLEALNYNGQST